MGPAVRTLLSDKKKFISIGYEYRVIYQLNKRPSGTKPAGSIFQKTIENVLQGLHRVINFMGVIVVTGRGRSI